MKIGIIGVGAVGSANKNGFEYLGHEVLIHDTKLNTKISEVCETEINYVCVPTPQAEDGSCDTSIIESVIDELGQCNYKGIIAIRSKVVPGFTQSM